MEKKHAFIQFIKFNLVGVINTLVDFLVFTLLTAALHVNYLPAKVVSYSCGLINSYAFNSRWTFRAENRRTKKQKALFVLVNLVALCVSLGAMWVLKNKLGVESDFLCNVVATPLSLVVNFVGNKLIVFRSSS